MEDEVVYRKNRFDAFNETEKHVMKEALRKYATAGT
jgi:hypothetical protein